MHYKAFGGRAPPRPAGELTALPTPRSLAGSGGPGPGGEGGRWKERRIGQRGEGKGHPL